MICNQIWEFLNIPENLKILPRTKCHIKVFCTYYYSFQVHYSFLLYFAARLNLYIFCSIFFGFYLTYSQMVHIMAQIGHSEPNLVHPTLKYTLGPLQWPKIHIKLGPVNCPKKKGPHKYHKYDVHYYFFTNNRSTKEGCYRQSVAPHFPNITHVKL